MFGNNSSQYYERFWMQWISVHFFFCYCWWGHRYKFKGTGFFMSSSCFKWYIRELWKLCWLVWTGLMWLCMCSTGLSISPTWVVSFLFFAGAIFAVWLLQSMEGNCISTFLLSLNCCKQSGQQWKALTFLELWLTSSGSLSKKGAVQFCHGLLNVFVIKLSLLFRVNTLQ